jgi:V/A-type H+/Na+-transporting ATPase subunit G/H
MQGLELIKNLAEFDRALTTRLEEARRNADLRVKSAETVGERLLAEVDTQLRRMEEASRTQIAVECAKLAEDSRQRADAAQEHLRRQAGPHLEHAVQLILARVLP